MPSAGSGARAAQFELMARYSHRAMISSEFADALAELINSTENLSTDDQINLREIQRQVKRAQAIPESLRAEQARFSALCHAAWIEARPQSDFSKVAPLLRKLVDLARAEAACLPEFQQPYDALLDIYEAGTTTAELAPLFEELANNLTQLLSKFKGKKSQLLPSSSVSSQQKLVENVLADLHFPKTASRLDVAAHPFMTTIGRGDTRITTRYDQTNSLSALYSVLHEYGHALYEMNLDEDQVGLPCGSACSLGIHESQSRLWENLVGRSFAFMQYLQPKVTAALNLSCSIEELLQNANQIEASLIRVEADEVTYSQHIVIRFLLEEQLINGRLQIEDLPEAWNSLYQKYLGVKPQNNRDGVMQDIHWYSGMIGYFPTYALGNLYAAQLWQHVRASIPQLDQQIAKGEFSTLQSYLKENVHKVGMRMHAKDLIEAITKKPLTSQPFIDYLATKIQ